MARKEFLHLGLSMLCLGNLGRNLKLNTNKTGFGNAKPTKAPFYL